MERHMSENISNISDADFESKVLKAEGLVLVDYWAPWCGPCRGIAPILEQIAEEYKDQLTVYKLNVDENQDTPQRYGVRGIPALMLFRGGEAIANKVGAQTKAQLSAFVEGCL